uniref:Ovule protein n=1 Tax=Parascaris univalens TaxID=6257 RepID=A0A915CH65_PARUN
MCCKCVTHSSHKFIDKGFSYQNVVISYLMPMLFEQSKIVTFKPKMYHRKIILYIQKAWHICTSISLNGKTMQCITLSICLGLSHISSARQ